MEKRQYSIEELENFSLEAYKSVSFQDFWDIKEQYMAIPKEQASSTRIVPVQVLINVMQGRLDEAKELAESILKSDDPHAEFIYHNVCLIIPTLTLEELESHTNALANVDEDVLGLTFSAGHPSLLNGYRDFSYFGDYLYNQKERFIKMLTVLYGKAAENMYNVGKAEFLYQTNQCLKAMARITKQIPLLEKSGDIRTLFAASCLQMQILVMNGELSSAVQMVKQIRSQVKDRANAELLYNLDALETKIAIYEGHYDIVTKWLENKAPNEYLDFKMHDLYGYMVKIRCYILTGRFIAGMGLISRLSPLLQKGLRPMDYCELQILTAIGGYKADLKEDCFEALEQALEIGYKYRYYRLFADEGEPLLKVLNAYRKAKPNAPHKEYIKEIIEITRTTALLYPNYLLEPFSKKIELTIHELDILKLLSHGLSYEEIAGQSNISINTVRYHIKKIYEKLDVNSSSEALSRARTLDLLK